MNKRAIVFGLFLLSIIVLQSINSSAGENNLAGLWYTLAEGADPAQVEKDIAAISSLGFDLILFPAHVRQKNVSSSEVSPPSAGYLALLGRAIDSAAEHNMKVSLTAFLLVGDGAWRGTIMPLSKKKWAVSYFNAIRPHIELAREKNIYSFFAGTEMESMKKEADVWKYIISKTREIYPGSVGYNTNWWSGPDDYNTILNKMTWLSEVDHIGVSGYFELTDDDSPPREKLAAAWNGDRKGQNLLEQISGLKNKYPDKKLFLWEIGYRTMDGTNRAPWNWGLKNPLDPDEQADCFAAFLSVFPGSALDGFGIWDQNPGLQSGETGYGFIGKPAESVIRDFLKNRTEPQ